VFNLSAPSASFLNQLALWAGAPVRKDVIEKYGDSWTEAGNLVGNGPFVLKEWVHNDHLTLEANQNWHLSKAKLSQVTVRIMDDDVAAYAAYLAGELDVAPIPPANRKEVMTPGSPLNTQLVRKPSLATSALMFNTQEKPWDNVKVRQAFATAVDRQSYVDGVLQGVGQPTTAWIPPGMPGYDGTLGKQYAFDPAKARQLLSEAGYPNGAGFPKVTLFLRSNDSNKLLGQFLQDQFHKNLGIDIEVELADSATYQSRFQKGQFNFSFGGWSADWPYPDNWLPEHFGSSGTFNVYHYNNAKVDDLFQKALSESDASKRLDLYGRAQKLVLDDAVVGPLYNGETFLLVKSHVRDLQITGLDGAIRGDWNLWKTWIAKS
jgi:oligopeptide transport system substrate-binding protein